MSSQSLFHTFFENKSAPDDTSECTLVLKLGYRGADFSGFAKQPRVRTVAGEIERALETVFRRPVDITCAGRTDAGVHAISQFVSMPIRILDFNEHRKYLGTSMTALLPNDISLRNIYLAPAGFSARFDALQRSYLYRISAGGRRPGLLWDFSWHIKHPLDANAMNEAAGFLLGEQDFVSFCKASSAVGHTTKRCVMSAEVFCGSEMGEDIIFFRISANAFLHNMVRTIAGTLVEVGLGRHDPDWVKMVLEAKDRRCAGVCAPAKGLTLCDVVYPADTLLSIWPYAG